MAFSRLSLLTLCGLLLGLSPLAASQDEADEALSHVFTIQGLSAKQPLRADGKGYDWDWRGPRNDPEWAWFFNRQSWLPSLLSAYQKTQDTRYSDALLHTIDDWIIQHPSPGRISFSSAWRPLEAARRLTGSWLPILPSLRQLPGYSAERADRLRASLIDHGKHLHAHHAFSGNHLITEMIALLNLALACPDLPGADTWLDYSLTQLEKSYDEQVYPDGAHTELSTHYQRVVALNFQQLINLLKQQGRSDLAAAWSPRVDRLWQYVHAVMTPSGKNPLNNDSDLENYQSLLKFNAPLLLQEPAITTHFPYAGQTVFRSGKSEPYWSFFEAGPRGTDHDHADHLQFDLSVGSDDFLVDNGRYTYTPGPWRDYFAGPTSHNTILLDGQSAAPLPPRVNTPPSSPRFRRDGVFEIAWGDTLFTNKTNNRSADWRRVVIHVIDTGWVVVDHIITFGTHELTTQWHWAPAVEFEFAGPELLARNPSSQLKVSAPAPGAWQIWRGSEPPAPVRGWYSPKFNQREPATQTDYVQTLRGPTTNVWIFQPTGAPHPLSVEVQNNRILISTDRSRLTLDPNSP